MYICLIEKYDVEYGRVKEGLNDDVTYLGYNVFRTDLEDIQELYHLLDYIRWGSVYSFAEIINVDESLYEGDKVHSCIRFEQVEISRFISAKKLVDIYLKLHGKIQSEEQWGLFTDAIFAGNTALAESVFMVNKDEDVAYETYLKFIKAFRFSNVTKFVMKKVKDFIYRSNFSEEHLRGLYSCLKSVLILKITDFRKHENFGKLYDVFYKDCKLDFVKKDKEEVDNILKMYEEW